MPTALLNKNNNYTSSDSIFIVTDEHDAYSLFTFLFHRLEYTYTSQVKPQNNQPLTDIELTKICMNISEQSLKEDWDIEDDERWNKLLTNRE